MDTIVCLVGESGTGKTEIVKQLEQFGSNIIISYTTRKPRKEGEWGHIYVNEKDYIFESENDKNDNYILNILDKKNNKYTDLIAYTYYDGDYYWATREQYQGKGVSIYVIDPAGIDALLDIVKDAKIIVIHLKVDEKIRWDRMYERENYNLDKINDINSRIENDREAFKLIKCNYVINNNGKQEDTIKLIKEILYDDL